MGSTAWTSVWSPVQGQTGRSPLLSWESIDHPVITTAPSTSALSGVPLLVQPVITILNQVGLTDLLSIGPVTVQLIGTGTLTGATTGLTVAGISIFVGLTITGSGVFQLLFSLPNGQSVLSANITVL